MSLSFLERLLPEAGMFCYGLLKPEGGFKHRWYAIKSELYEAVIAADRQGQTVYIAQASFIEPKNRKHENVKNVRNFFFDIDCGPGKPFATQRDGATALKTFCDTTGLPFPSLVNSGNGLYAHWILNRDLPAAQWKAIANILKQLTLQYKFSVDQSRTADLSSVLRPVGVHNRKNSLIKPVTLIHEASDIAFDDFAGILQTAAKKAKIDTTLFSRPSTEKYTGINDEFSSGIGGPESDLKLVAEKCQQIRSVRDLQGDVPEPVWYDFIGVARHCLDGEELIHEWSSGHTGYSPEETDRKIQHHIESGMGPTTCVKFGSDDPAGCLACPYVNKIKSPIVLGRPEAAALTAEEVGVDEEDFFVPHGFARTTDGMKIEVEGVLQRFYPYDLYLTRLAYDYSLGYETVTICHKLPMEEKYREFTVRSALIHDHKALLMALSDQHVHTPGGESRKHMTQYVDAYMTDLRKKRALAHLHSQMGWRENDGELVFSLGEQVLRRGVDPEPVGLARNVPMVAKSIKEQGSLEAWVDATKYFALPGMEPMAFTLLAGAFGAPLLRFTGYAGAMVAMIGESGIGKTMLGKVIASAYGDPQQLILNKEDTRNFLVQRLGLYGSLPLYLDEVSNIEGQDFSDLVYRITQGRDKGRLHRSGNEREFLNQWNTLAVVSSNHSLYDKLAALKADPSAEINRVLEIYIGRQEMFGRAEASAVYNTIHDNYGVVGPRFIQYLVDWQDHHREKIDILVKQLDEKTGAQAEERFWSNIAGTAIYGGLVAAKLGLIKFPVAPVMEWVAGQIKVLRGNKQDLVVSQIDLLGQFLDENLNGVVITKGNSNPKDLVEMIKEPRGALVARINVDTHRLIISRSALKTWLTKKYGSYSTLKAEIERIGAMISADNRRVLGAGTYIGGTQQPVWEIDLRVPALGRQALAVVRSVVGGDKKTGEV